MRHSGLLAIFAVFTMLFAVGCGGGNGGNSASTAVNGIWNGTSTQTRAVGDSTPMQAEFVLKGTSLTGAVILAAPAKGTVAFLTGTVHGDQLTASGFATSGATLTFTGVVSSTGITGTYTNMRTSEAGTFTITKTTGVTTPNLTKIATEWGGDYIAAGSADVPLTFKFTQTGNDLAVDGTTGFGGIGVPGSHFSGNGAIIGNNVTIISPGPNNVMTYFTGTFNGAVVSGTTLDTQGQTGAFRVAPPQ